VILGGCAAKTGTESNKSKTGQFNNANISLPDRDADVVGVVKSMTGNQVAISQIDMDVMMEKMRANMPTTSSTNAGDTEKKTSNLVQTTGVPGGGRTGGGNFTGSGRPGGMAGAGGSEDAIAARDTMLKELLKDSKGDIDLIIPVGIQMTSRGGEASLADVKVGSMLNVWLNQEITDRKIAEFVSLR